MLASGEVYDRVIKACLKDSKLHNKALGLFHKAKEGNVRLSLVTVNMILRGCAQRRQVDALNPKP
jgi:hypothetical protein